MDDKEVLNVKIGGVVNAGVIAYVDGVRGFIPASRLSLDHVDDLNVAQQKDPCPRDHC